jgi:hypothetical protein
MRARLLAALALPLLLLLPRPAVADLLVGSALTDQVLRYEGSTGAFIGLRVADVPAGTGAATLIGTIGSGGDFPVQDIAVRNIPVPGSPALLGIGAAALLMTIVGSQRKRSGELA